MNLGRALIILVLVLTFLATVPAVFAGCCINDQPSFQSPTTDTTCQVTSQAQCQGSYVATSVDCRDVPQCGCCVANPQSQNPQVFNLPNYLTTENFCTAYFPNQAIAIIANKSSQQCAALVGQPGPISTTSTPSTPPTLQGTGNITGIARSGGFALSNISLTLLSGATPVATQTTNAQGSFTFLSQSFGNYSIKSNSCGYLPQEQTIVTTTALTNIQISLDQAPRERFVIEAFDSRNIPLDNVQFAITPSLSIVAQGQQLPVTVTGRATILDVPANCQYTLTATFGSQIQTKSISVLPGDGVTDNPVTITFSAAGDPCAGISDCRGPDKILGQGVDCTALCSSGTICDASSGQCAFPQGADCCSYSFQCDKNATVTPAPASCTAQQIACSQQCLYVPHCPPSTTLSIGSSGYVCECSSSLGVIKSGTPLAGSIAAAGKFCCTGSFASNRCEYQTHARIYGTIIDNSGPIAAEIVIDSGTSEESKHYTNSSGNYEIFLKPNVPHTLRFQKAPAHTPVTRNLPALAAGIAQKIEITLGVPIGPCDSPRSPTVPSLSVQHIGGKAAAKVVWDNAYCGQNKPRSFIVTNEKTKERIIVDGTTNSYTFDTLNWNETYSFSVQALYTDNNNPRLGTRPTISASFDPGDAACEGQNAGKEFCATATQRRMCTSENLLSTAVTQAYFDDCSDYKRSGISQNEWHCAADTGGRTKCLEQSSCGYQAGSVANIPFLGLLFSDILCSENLVTGRLTNACYLDSSNTPLDFCFKCPKPGDATFKCENYRSEFACTQNRCGIPSDCAWDATTFAELGKGVCYDKKNVAQIKYEQKGAASAQFTPTVLAQSSCSLCSSGGELFSNTFCTQDICSQLGLCYSQNTSFGSSCAQCQFGAGAFGTTTTCNSYRTQQSCIDATGRSQAFTERSGTYTFSDDACGIGRCVWDGIQCFKDGDANGQPDCKDPISGNILQHCENDIVAPLSHALINSSFLSKNFNDPQNIIRFNISERINSFNYCLYAEGSSPCTQFANISGTDPRVTTSSTGVVSLAVNPLLTFGHLVTATGGYRLRYSAVDFAKNKEAMQEIPFIIDPQKPSVFIDLRSDCVNCDKDIDCSKREAYVSAVTVSLFSDELVSCSDLLEGPGTGTSTVPLSKTFILSPTDTEVHSFGANSLASSGANGLKDGTYHYTLRCSDGAGNEKVEKRTLVLDSNKIIKSVEPRAARSSINISYAVETNSPSTCAVSIDANAAIALDSTNSLIHSKNFQYQPNVYHSYEVFCQELRPLTPNRCDTSVQEFIVDTEPPRTKVLVNSREYALSSWEAMLANPADVEIISEDGLGSGALGISLSGLSGSASAQYGYGINYTRYCITTGARCDPTTGILVSAQDEIRLPVKANTGLCYFAGDNGGNRESTKCGRILFDIPPTILISAPVTQQQSYVTGTDRITITGTHSAATVNSSQIVISNGALQRTVPFTVLGASFVVPIVLYPGKNIVAVQITNGAGVTGESILEAYYDRIGPQISSTTPPTAEYGQNFTIGATVQDTQWTVVETNDNIGRISLNATQVVLESLLSNFSETYPLTSRGASWESLVVPRARRSGFFDITPGTYRLTFVASDIFGNRATLVSNLSVEDTTPGRFTISLDQFGSRDQNTFFVRQQSPRILVASQDPAECDINILSTTPAQVIRLLSSGNGLNHTFSSSLLSFVPGKKQRFDAQVLCHDLTSSSARSVDSVTIIYDDQSPELILSSTSGKRQIEKDAAVYELDLNQGQGSGSANQGTIVPEFRATDVQGDELICSFSCIKDSTSACGTIHVAQLGQFGSRDFSATQRLTVEYDREDNPYGEYDYLVRCTDRANNSNTGRIFVSVRSSDYAIVERGPVSKTNTTAPVLSVRTNYPSSSCKITSFVPDRTMQPQSQSNVDFTYLLGQIQPGTQSGPHTIVCTRESGGETAATSFSFIVDPSYSRPTPPSPVTQITLPDKEVPLITDVRVNGVRDQAGIRTTKQKDYEKGVELVSGKNALNEFLFQLIVDTNERARCRYSTAPLTYSGMQNVINSVPSYYPKTSFLKLADGRQQTYYVACEDGSGNVGRTYRLDLSTNSRAPLRIDAIIPERQVNRPNSIVSGITQRALTCSYDDGVRRDIPLYSSLNTQGYLQSSARFPGQTISPGEGFHQFGLRCTLLGITPSIPDLQQNISFEIDTVPPTLTITDPPQNSLATSEGSISIKGITEPGVTLSFIVNGVPQKEKRIAQSSFDERIYLEQQGINDILLVVRDPAGNSVSGSVVVTAASALPWIRQVSPYRSDLPSLAYVQASLAGSAIDFSSSTIVLLDANANTVQGRVATDPARSVIMFIPAAPLSDGGYSFEVTPKDTSGKIGYGFFSSFTIRAGSPAAQWESPAESENVVAQQSPTLAIRARSANAERLITDASFRAGPSLDQLAEYPVYRTGDRYSVDAIGLPQEKIFALFTLEDLGGVTKSMRVLTVRTEGPIATISPADQVTTTRPKITARFDQPVTLKSFSLRDLATNQERVIVVSASSTQEFTFTTGTQLLPGTYQFTIAAEDKYGNVRETSEDFIVAVSSIELALKNPKYGASATQVFDLEFETNQDAECRYSNINAGSNFAAFAGAFDETGSIRHRKQGYRDVTVQLPQEQNLYVICRSSFAPSVISVFSLSFDNRAPQIVSAGAHPNPVTEFPLETTLDVRTDKSSICRYDCSGKTDFNDMTLSFGQTFITNHSLTMPVQDKTSYSCAVACVSKADLEAKTSLSFIVDSSLDAEVFIVSPADGSAHANSSVPLLITTQRTAQCQFILDNSSAVSLPGVGREFKGTLQNLSDGRHTLEASCLLTQGAKIARSSFSIDRTPPKNLSIADGVEACSGSGLNVSFSAVDAESGIKEYRYQIKTKGGNQTVVLNWTTTQSAVLTQVPGNLIAGETHIFTVIAINGAGLESEAKVSDGFLIDPTKPLCSDTAPPLVTVNQDAQEGVTYLAILCNDLNGTGCNTAYKYNVHPNRNSCKPDVSYNGSVAVRENNSYFCYHVVDLAGNAVENSVQVQVLPAREIIPSQQNQTLTPLNQTPTPYLPQSSGAKGSNYWYWIIAVIVLVLAGIGGGAYYIYYTKQQSARASELQKRMMGQQTGARSQQSQKLGGSLQGSARAQPGAQAGTPSPSQAKMSSPRGVPLPAVRTAPTTSDDARQLRELKQREKEKIRANLFGTFIEEKGKLERLKKEIRPETPSSKSKPSSASPALRGARATVDSTTGSTIGSTASGDAEVSFAQLEELLSQSKEFEQLVKKTETPLKKSEFEALQELAEKKGVAVSRSEFDNLLDLVNRTKKSGKMNKR